MGGASSEEWMLGQLQVPAFRAQALESERPVQGLSWPHL